MSSHHPYAPQSEHFLNSYFTNYAATIDHHTELPPISFLVLGKDPRITPTQFRTFATLVNGHSSRRNDDGIEKIVEYLSLDHTALDDPKLPGLLPKFSNIKGISIEYPPGGTDSRQWGCLPSEFRNAWAENMGKVNGIGITGILAYPGHLFKDVTNLKELYLNETSFDDASVCDEFPRPRLESLQWTSSDSEKFREFVEVSNPCCDIAHLTSLSVTIMGGEEEGRKMDALTGSLVVRNAGTLRQFHCRLDPRFSEGINLAGVPTLERLALSFTPLDASLDAWLPLAIINTIKSGTAEMVIFRIDVKNTPIQGPTTQGKGNWDNLDIMLDAHGTQCRFHVFQVGPQDTKWVKVIQGLLPHAYKREALHIQ